MKYEFKPSFDRSVKSLPPKIKQEVKELCITLIDVLSGERELSLGMGLKNLFRWQADHVEFVMAGTHEVIKRYLKR